MRPVETRENMPLLISDK